MYWGPLIHAYHMRSQGGRQERCPPFLWKTDVWLGHGAGESDHYVLESLPYVQRASRPPTSQALPHAVCIACAVHGPSVTYGRWHRWPSSLAPLAILFGTPLLTGAGEE